MIWKKIIKLPLRSSTDYMGMKGSNSHLLRSYDVDTPVRTLAGEPRQVHNESRTSEDQRVGRDGQQSP